MEEKKVIEAVIKDLNRQQKTIEEITRKLNNMYLTNSAIILSLCSLTEEEQE